MTPIDFLSSRFHYTYGAHAPTLQVQPGDAIRVTCPDCDNVMADGSVLTEEQRHVDTPDAVQGNPLAGPIYIEDAKPGDTLAVTINAVELDRELGMTLLAPSHGVLPDHRVTPLIGDEKNAGSPTTPRHMYHWQIDTTAGTATMSNPVGGQALSVQLDPFVGCIGVCPAKGCEVSSLNCGEFGGNLDLPMVRPGTTVFLPVNREGALLMMGDLHAAQGHGEVIGGGIETSGKIVCTVGIIKGAGIESCRMRDSQMLWAIGTHDDLQQAIQLAYAGLLDWLAQPGVVDRYDMYNLLSQTATVTVGNLNEAPYPAAAGVRLDRLPDAVIEAIKPWTL